MEIHHHGQRQSKLNDRAGEHDLVDEERDTRDGGDGPGSPERLREQAQLDSELRSARKQVEVAAGVAKIGEGCGQRAGRGCDGRRGKRAKEADGKEGQLEAAVEELFGVKTRNPMATAASRFMARRSRKKYPPIM